MAQNDWREMIVMWMWRKTVGIAWNWTEMIGTWIQSWRELVRDRSIEVYTRFSNEEALYYDCLKMALLKWYDFTKHVFVVLSHLSLDI